MAIFNSYVMNYQKKRNFTLRNDAWSIFFVSTLCSLFSPISLGLSAIMGIPIDDRGFKDCTSGWRHEDVGVKLPCWIVLFRMCGGILMAFWINRPTWYSMFLHDIHSMYLAYPPKTNNFGGDRKAHNFPSKMKKNTHTKLWTFANKVCRFCYIAASPALTAWCGTSITLVGKLVMNGDLIGIS